MPCFHRLSDLGANTLSWGPVQRALYCWSKQAHLEPKQNPNTCPLNLCTQPHFSVWTVCQNSPTVNAMKILFSLRSVIPLWLKLQLEMKYWMVLIDFCWCRIMINWYGYILKPWMLSSGRKWRHSVSSKTNKQKKNWHVENIEQSKSKTK